MAHYLIAHLNGGHYGDGQVLSEAGINELLRPAVEWREMGFSVGYYAMGWVSQKFDESRIVSHGGTVPDFGAFMALVPEQRRGLVLLCNANSAMMKMTLDEMGMRAAQHLAGVSPSPQIFSAAPWVMRSILLIPILQIAGVFATLLLLSRWRADPAHRPSAGACGGSTCSTSCFH